MSNALGIDLGSSKIAAVIVDDQAVVVDAVSILLPEQDESDRFMERDPQSILLAVDTAVKSLNATAKESVTSIGICGQMHGVLLWNDLDRDHGPLITWEDRRAEDGTFLRELRRATGVEEIHSGYGTVTLAWLKRYEPQALTRFRYAGTIMDYLVARCCDTVEPTMDHTNAAGWGFFNFDRRDWNVDAFAKTGVPTDLLPAIRPTGSKVGELCGRVANDWGLRVDAGIDSRFAGSSFGSRQDMSDDHSELFEERITRPRAKRAPASGTTVRTKRESIPVSAPRVDAGISVAVACGDNPAAVFSCNERLEDGLFLNVGTGSQLSVVVDESTVSALDAEWDIEVRPFLPNRYLVVAASVCGGKSFQWLVETVETWFKELKVEVPDRDRLFEILNDLGESCQESSPPKFLPYFKEERHHPNMLGSISGIGWSNLSLSSLTKSLVRGMIESLWERIPAHLLEGKTSIIATGNGIRRLSLLRTVAEEVTGLPLVVPELLEEAATGAARLARRHMGSGTPPSRSGTPSKGCTG